MILDKNYYLETFGVTEDLLRSLVAEGIARGGDYADLYFESSTLGSLLLRDGEVTSGGSHIDYGVGIRVLSGEKTGYAYAESTRLQDMLSAVRAASAIAGGNAPKGFSVNATLRSAHGRARKFFPGSPNPAADRYPVRESWREKRAAALLPFLTRLDSAVRQKDPRICRLTAMLSYKVSDILMFNSLEELKYDTRPLASVVVSAVFAQGGKTDVNSVSRSWRMGVEMLSDELIRDMADEVTRGMDERFAARRPKGGEMSVVMGAGASGILLHEAMGHAFEADFNRKGQSVFSGQIGKEVCARGIHILDDATLKGSRGALNYDDEGVPGQKTYMVEDGRLTSYLHDRISARFFGVSPTGNGRRESFRYAPIPRMRTTYMESGNAEPESIIASVRDGIFVDEFSNGQVKIGEGDFTFYVKSGFLIENGRLTMPVKDINIIGNGPRALADIVAVGNDLKIDEGAWTCGKEQSVPVGCGIPTVLVSRLTVGGE